MVNPKLVQIMKLAKELVDSRDKDFSGFEGGLSSKDGRLFKLKLKRAKEGGQ